MTQARCWRPSWLGGAVLTIASVLALESASAQTLRMWTFLDPEAARDPRERVMAELIRNFEEANPGVDVVVEPQVWQQMTEKFFAAHQTGTAPDIMWVHLRRLPEAIELGTLANLNDLFVDDWSEEEIADLDGSFWQYGASPPDTYYQITHSRSTVGQFYRTDLFEEAGIDPASLSTWDKFVQAAEQLTVRDGSGNVTRWGFGQAFATDAANNSVVFSMILDQEGRLFDEDNRAVWSTPAGVEGLTLQTDMITNYAITSPTAVSERNDDLYDQFAAGRVAIIRGAAARIPRLMEALGADKVGFLPTPSFTEGKMSPAEVSGWAVSVWSGSENIELAGKFVEYMSSKEADRMWTMEAGAVPIRQSTIDENPEFFADPQNAYLVDVARSMREAGWFPPDGGGDGWNEELNKAAQDVLTNGTDPKTALEKAEQDFNRQNRL